MAVGLRRTTMSDVARRAGLSRMTLYRAFADLEEVVTMLMEREFEAVIAAQRAALDSLPDGRARLVEGTLGVIERLSAHRLLRRIAEVDPELLLPYLLDHLGGTQQTAMAALEELVRQGVDDGSIAAPDPSATAYCLLIVGQSFIVSSRISEREGRSEEALRELRRLIEGYVAPRAADGISELMSTASRGARSTAQAGRRPLQ